MHVVKHTIASGVVSTIFVFYTRSVDATIVCFLSGIFIDIDHILDFWIAKKNLFFTYDDLDRFCGHEKRGKLYLIFHSYEFMAVLWLMVPYFNFHHIWFGMTLGLTCHLLLDMISNPLKRSGYSFIYRLKNRFGKEYLFPEKYYQDMQ